MEPNALETTVSDIIARLRQGRFPNEQAISQGIVLRVLQELGWDTWDTAVVWPEYQTGQGRADFALCHPPSKPAIFIEVKQPGKAEDAVRQALEYAFHTGVPFIVLTDGRTWSFYLPAEQGSYEAESARRHDDVFGANRRVYKLDLFERPPAEAADIRCPDTQGVEFGGPQRPGQTDHRCARDEWARRRSGQRRRSRTRV